MLVRFEWALLRVLLAGALFTSTSFGANNANMNKIFTVDSSCGDLDPMLADTFALARGALDAIAVLRTTDRFALGSTERNYMRNMHSSFGTSYKFIFTRGGLSDADKDIMNKVAGMPHLHRQAEPLLLLTQLVGNFQRIIDYLEIGILPYDNLIVCDTRNYQQATDLRLIDRNRQVTYSSGSWLVRDNVFQGGTQVDSVWYIPGYMDPNTQVERAVLVDSVPPCVGNTILAETFTRPVSPRFEYKQILLCDGFRQELSHDALQRAHDDPANAPGRDGAATSLVDNYSSMAGTFLHELLHLIATNVDDWEDHAFTYSRRPGKIYQPYDAANIYAVANKRSRVTPVDSSLPFDVLGFPDAYKLFAESCYIPKRWSTRRRGPVVEKRMVTLEEGETFMASNSSST